MKKPSALFYLCIFASASLLAQEISPKILKERWSAFWIAVPGEPAHDYGVYNFRKTVELKEKPSSFNIHVSADNRYKLYVNDQLVSLGPARGDLYHWNFETIDIAPYLQSGKNTVSAVVWNFGDQRAEAQISDQTAFILQGNSQREEILNTNKSWKCKRDDSYKPLPPELVYSYYAAGPGEKVDNNKHESGWSTLAFDDTSWKTAQELFNGLPKGVFDFTVGWMLVPRPIPAMELTAQRLASVRKAEGIPISKAFPSTKTLITIPAHKKISMLLDQGYLTNAYPVLYFSKGKNALITLGYAEALYKAEGAGDWRAQNKKGNRNEIEGKRFVGVSDQIISNGTNYQRYSPLSWRTYRYLKVEVETREEALLLEDLYGMFTGYPFQMKAELKVSNPELSKIMEVGWRTARLCAMETYMDCPYYEQLQYIGDTRIQSLVSFFNSGDDRLVRHAITQLNDSRMAEGITLSRYPTAHAQEIPPFSLWWIGMLHDYYIYRPDTEFVKDKLAGLRQVLRFFSQYQQEDGSLKNVPYWNFSDWAEADGWKDGVAPKDKDGSSAPLDLQLLWAYQLAAKLETDLGLNDYAALYHKNAEQLRVSIRKKYWDEGNKLFADTPEKKNFSQHTNTLAILTEVVTGEESKQLAIVLLSDKSLTQATIYFKYYLHQAVAKAGFGNRYLDLLGDWKNHLASGLTTWAEISDANINRSDCHAWGSSPNIEFFRIVLGIDSDAPGFRKVKIEPHLGSLTQAQGKIPHPQGEIEVNYYQLNEKWKAEITLPPNTEGRFIWKGKEYSLNVGKKNVLSF